MTVKILDVLMAAGAAAAILMGSFKSFAEECEHIPNEVLRLHIPANSDSEADQNIKLEIRDFVLEKYGSELSECSTLEQAVQTSRELLPEIERSCCDFLQKNGFTYGAKAELTEMYFTTRQYEQVTLPAGNYTALRITLGSGEGHNWWCVMFPQLCIPLASKRAEDLLPGEFITKGKVEIRFAVFEFFKQLFG